MKKIFLLLLLSGYYFLYSQSYKRASYIPVTENNTPLKNPWVGGHNFCQVSSIDINLDGIRDIFVFDRSGNKITTYINKGTPNMVDYIDSTFKYASAFPKLEDWVLLLDYNCDGKEDIFTYATYPGGVEVWKNISTANQLQFTRAFNYLKTKYPTTTTNLFVSRVDIPAISDVDNDGDLDILTFGNSDLSVAYHINQRVEKGYPCDSMVFLMDPSCWGKFEENPNNCSIDLNKCTRGDNPIIPNAKKPLHAGSCTVCLDMDNDGDKELLIGDISCCNLTLLTNGGTPALAHVTAKDTLFPAGNPLQMGVFPCGYLADVDNDGRNDLVVAPNLPGSSVNKKSIWYYKNSGSNNAYQFATAKKSLFHNQTIDIGENSDPVFFDFNQDGLVDILVSNANLKTDTCLPATYFNTWAYKNVGSATSPSFELATTNFANLSTQLPNLYSNHLTFGDLDNDGDQDLMVGSYNGNLFYLENSAPAGTLCNFTIKQSNYLDANSKIIDVGNQATPQLIDADRDGDLDLIIGSLQGRISFYRNTGTPSLPLFTLVTDSFGKATLQKGNSVPFLYDDGTGYQLLVGSKSAKNSYLPSGWIWHYNNIDGNLNGKFTLVDSCLQKIWEGEQMTVNGKDINQDGKMDLIIGNKCGGIVIYYGDSTPLGLPTFSQTGFDFTIYPNPASNQIRLVVADFKTPLHYTVSLINAMGEVVGSYNLSEASTLLTLHLARGIYSCVLSCNGIQSAKKLIILE